MQSRSNTGLASGWSPVCDAVAGQAQHVRHAHRGPSEDVALDRDAVLVAAGDLLDQRVAEAGQQRADRQAPHVAVRAAAVGRVDRVDRAVEQRRALVDGGGVGAVGRGELARDDELPAPEEPLETPRRAVPGQDRHRVAGHRLVSSKCAALMRSSPVGAGRGDDRVVLGRGGRPGVLAGSAAKLPGRARVQRTTGTTLPIAVSDTRARALLADDAQPRRAALQAVIDGELHGVDRVPVAHPLRARPALDPDAAHLGLDLAVAVGPDAPAGTVPDALGAVHRARHAGARQRALTAHLAVEQRALDRALDGGDRLLEPLVPDPLDQRRRGEQRALDDPVERLHGAGVPHRPLAQRVHALFYSAARPLALTIRSSRSSSNASTSSAAARSASSRSSAPHGLRSRRQSSM